MIPKLNHNPLQAFSVSVAFACVQCPCGGILTVYYDCVETSVANSEDVDLVLGVAVAAAIAVEVAVAVAAVIVVVIAVPAAAVHVLVV